MPGLADRCGVCAREFGFSLQRCGVCRKPVCADCLVRMSGGVFCGRICAHAFFYGGDEDTEDRGSSAGYEEEE